MHKNILRVESFTPDTSCPVREDLPENRDHIYPVACSAPGACEMEQTVVGGMAVVGKRVVRCAFQDYAAANPEAIPADRPLTYGSY